MGFTAAQSQMWPRIPDRTGVWKKMDSWHGKRVVILGLARQGTALAAFAAGVGAEVVVSDLRRPAQLGDVLAELDDLPITYVLGEHPMTLL